MKKANKLSMNRHRLVDQDIQKMSVQHDNEIDTTDIPDDAVWGDASIGKFYRPVKQSVTIRLDADVLAWFRDQGSGYQTRINQVLRNHMNGQ